ncbi:hypothetical protein [Symbiobacterium terraclitae]|uniref:hypothetical protein n=1 Tax=Symbiobacterium terraclitae TaxID=557451 RepID=UPI0035B521E1
MRAVLGALLLVPLLPFFLLILTPPAVIPLASPEITQLYQDGVTAHLRTVADETTPGEVIPAIDWREVLVVEAVRREQQLDRVTSSDALRAAERFTKRRRREEEHCSPAPPDAESREAESNERAPSSLPDSTEDPTDDSPDEPPLECETVEIIWYEAVPFDEVLSQLRFSPDRVRWAHDMLRTLTNVSE